MFFLNVYFCIYLYPKPDYDFMNTLYSFLTAHIIFSNFRKDLDMGYVYIFKHKPVFYQNEFNVKSK